MSHYVTGRANWRTLPTPRTKPPSYTGGSWDTGAGYERFRSKEHDPTHPRDGKTDVYVYHHRLLAVVACYPDDMAVRDILDHMDGRDVHHSAPEVDAETGVKWDNRPECLTVVDHGSHSAVTQAQMRAWAEDDKRQAEAIERGQVGTQRCERCDDDADILVTGDDFDGQRCLTCAKQQTDDGVIHL